MTAEQRAGLSDAALAMTQPCIDELIRDVSRHIKKAGAITDTAEYQIYRAQALGESKSAIEKAVAKQLDINEEVIKYIATNIKSNIRELEGAFNKVMASSKLEKKEVTLSLAEEALKDIISPNEQKIITPEYIISIVAEHYHVTVADLCGNKRSSKIVMPRQIAMYLCREILDTSLKTIGKNLGDRDHTTVMHGIEKIEKELANNENLEKAIDTLKKKINPQG